MQQKAGVPKHFDSTNSQTQIALEKGLQNDFNFQDFSTPCKWFPNTFFESIRIWLQHLLEPSRTPEQLPNQSRILIFELFPLLMPFKSIWLKLMLHHIFESIWDASAHTHSSFESKAYITRREFIKKVNNEETRCDNICVSKQVPRQVHLLLNKTSWFWVKQLTWSCEFDVKCDGFKCFPFHSTNHLLEPLLTHRLRPRRKIQMRWI